MRRCFHKPRGTFGWSNFWITVSIGLISRVLHSSDNSSNINGRRYAWRGTGSANSAPTNSAEVIALSSKSFLNSSNNGSFSISIPAGTPEIYFSVPFGKTVLVTYRESSNADVTGSFTKNTFDVNDADGQPVSYDNYVAEGYYPSTATFDIVIS